MPQAAGRRRPALVAVRTLACSLLCSQFWTSAAAAPPAPPAPAMLAACAACHEPGGGAYSARVPKLAGQPKLFIENQLVLMREGLREVAEMRGIVAALKDEEIIALATHYAALPLARPTGPVQAEKYRLGAQTSRAMFCGSCHLPDYAGQAQVPRLAGQNEAYLVLAMKEFRDRPGPGRDTIMSAALQGLKDSDMANLAHYLAHHRP